MNQKKMTEGSYCQLVMPSSELGIAWLKKS